MGGIPLLVDSPPPPKNMSPRLPKEWSEIAETVQYALRTQDKRSLTYNRFMTKRTGFNLKMEDLVLRDIVYTSDTFRQYLAYSCNQMVLAYLAKCQDFLVAQQGGLLRLVLGDYLYFDASRVACKEVMLVMLSSHGKLMSAPLQVLTDSSAGLDPVQGLKRMADAMQQELTLVPCPDQPDQRMGAEEGKGGGESRGRGRSGRGRGRGRGARVANSTAHEKTQLYLRALVQALLCLLPFADLRPWVPSTFVTLSDEGFVREFDDRAHAYYLWQTESPHVSKWCLAPELQESRRGVRILTFCADEGSEGWSLFQYLASPTGGLRVFFLRDPNHRLSNGFTAALRGNPTTLASTMDIMLVHKYRRAPYGGGTFWKQALEALEALLNCADANHDLLQTYATSILRDHEVPAEAVGSSLTQVQDLMGYMAKMSMGQRVEMRRWFTYQKAGWDLVRIWHTLLVSLIAQLAMEGQNPWAIMRAPPPPRGQRQNTDKNFEFKVTVLRVLANSFNQMMLRSTLVCNKRLHSHHAGYERDAQKPKVSFNYLLVWSSWPYWVSNYVIKTFQDAFFDKKQTAYVGLEQCSCPSPLVGQQEFADDDPHVEAEELLFHHARNCFSTIKEMLLYAFLWTCAPWSFVRLLHPRQEERQKQMDDMRETFEVYLRLCRSGLRVHGKYLKALFYCSWAVWREPMQIFERAQWNPGDAQGLSYIAAMFGAMEGWEAYTNTLPVENTFNALRDNEGRGARHKCRSDFVLQGLAISTMATRFENDPVELISINDEDSSRYQDYATKPASFRAKDAPTSNLGVDYQSIKAKTTWQSTTSNLFVLNTLALMKALTLTDSSYWDRLWVVTLFREHMVVDVQQAAVFLIDSPIPFSAPLITSPKVKLGSGIGFAANGEGRPGRGGGLTGYHYYFRSLRTHKRGRTFMSS